jgi:hypothetical protein
MVCSKSGVLLDAQRRTGGPESRDFAFEKFFA